MNPAWTTTQTWEGMRNKTLLPSHTELGRSTTLQSQSRDYLTPRKMVTVGQTLTA